MVSQTRESTITKVPPSFATLNVKDGWRWLEMKRKDDAVEDGLWRIHNTLYDLTEFVHQHPGGEDWIQMTKGHDITEAVETHHVFQDRLQPFLRKYKVRDTDKPRNSRLTFDENGFYVTLRNRVAAKLPELNDRKLQFWSKFYIDALFITTLILSIFAMRLQSYSLALFAGLTYTWTGIAGHNFFHQRDNYRMYYFNLMFMNYRDWRITHVLSHHLFPNSLLDFEVLIIEPIMVWLPSSKNFIQRYGSWLYSPIVYAGFYYVEFLKKIALSLTVKNHMSLDDAVPFVVPLTMYLCGGDGANASNVFKWFLIILTISSFVFALIGLNAGHHHPESVHEGDAIRKNFDWGFYSIDTTIDRKESRQSTIWALTHFGDHALHHLFPTLDHAVLPYLYDELFATLAEFEGEAKAYPFWELISGQFQQLARTQPMEMSSHERFKSKDD